VSLIPVNFIAGKSESQLRQMLALYRSSIEQMFLTNFGQPLTDSIVEGVLRRLVKR
jgi:hypothetical protein